MAPPVSVGEHNLKFMQTLGASFGIPYGLSDHHIGEEMLYAAAALGASIVEKGICPDELGDEQDRAHALNISQAAKVQNNINNIAQALGSGSRKLDRKRDKYISRMGLVAKVDIQKGSILTEKNVTFAFPVIGIPVEHTEFFLGKIIKKSIKKNLSLKNVAEEIQREYVIEKLDNTFQVKIERFKSNLSSFNYFSEHDGYGICLSIEKKIIQK